MIGNNRKTVLADITNKKKGPRIPMILEMTPTEFEQSVDKVVKQMEIFRLPSKCIFSVFFGVIDRLFNGKRFCKNIDTRTNEGCSLISRLSYLVPLLLLCDSKQTGSCAFDTIQAYVEVDPTGEQLRILQAYGHFCEIMPEVHKGHYEVLECNEKRLKLVHKNLEFSRFETLDILISELALPYFVRIPTERMAVFDLEAEKLPKYNIELIIGMMNTFYNHHVTNSYELPILSSRGFLLAVEVPYEDFKNFRAAWLAFADYCLGMASAISHLGVNDISRQEHLGLSYLSGR